MDFDAPSELLIWLPAHLVEEDANAAIESAVASNGKILDFLDGETVLEDVAETIFDAGIDVDAWLHALHSF